MNSSFPCSRASTRRFATVAAAAVLTLSGCALFAADKTWDGEGANDNWLTGANWDPTGGGGVAPVALDSLFFDGATRLTPNNNFASGTIFRNLIFNGGASAFNLVGNSLTLTGGVAFAVGTTDTTVGNADGGNINNASASLQTISLPLTLSAGHHNIMATSSSLNLAGPITRNPGAGVSFATTGGNINLAGSGLANVNGILGGWAILGSDWASLDGGNNVVAYTAYTDLPSGALPNNSAANIRLIGDTANYTATNIVVNSILGQLGTARTLTIGGTMKISPGGGIYGRNALALQSLTISGGTLTVNGGGEMTLIAQPFTPVGGGLTITSIITNDNTSVVSLNVRGNVALNAANTYTGNTYIYQNARLNGNNANSAGASSGGAVYVYPGGQYFFGGNVNVAKNFFIAGLGTAEVSGGQTMGAIRMSGGGSTLSGTITLLEDARIASGATGANVISGKITGPGKLEITASTGDNTGITLNNPGNDWSGGLVLTSAGSASRSVALKLGANNQIPDGAGKGDLTLNGVFSGVRLDLNGFSDTINGLISVSSANNLVTNSSATTGTLTVGGNDATATFGGNVLGNLGIAKIGAGTQTFTGSCNYSNATTVSGGSLVFGTGATLPNTSAITVGNNATLNLAQVSPSSLVALLSSFNSSNGTTVLPATPVAPTFSVTNFFALGATNYLTISSIGPIFSYPAQFPIIKGTNVTGTLNFGLAGALPPAPGTPYAGYISNNVANNSVDLYLTAGPLTIKWQGYAGGSPNSSWDTSSANWITFGGVPSLYTDGWYVRFDDSASNNVVALNMTVSPGGITVSNSSLAYTFNGGNAISGSGSLIKQGAGSLVLDNTAANDFSGGVNIGAGTLQIGNADTAGNLPAVGNVVNNGALVFSRTDDTSVGNVISGTGSLTKNGGGVLNLGGANSFTGAVTVAQGTLQIGNASALGTTNGITTIASGATLDFNAINIGVERVTVGGTGVGGNGALINNGATIFPAVAFVTLSADTKFGGSGRWDLRSSATGNPGLSSLTTVGNQVFNITKVGVNQVSIVGTTVSTNVGNVDVQQGILSLEVATTGLGNTASNLNIATGATLAFFRLTNQLNKVITLNGDGVVVTVDNTQGANTIIGPMTLVGNCLFNTVGSDTGSGLTLSNNISGAGMITKQGIQPLILSGNANHAATLVNVGKLVLNGKHAGGLTNAVNTVIAGAGTNNGPTDVLGIVTPGDTNGVIGTLTFSNLVLEAGATLSFDLSNVATPGGTNNDLINVNGDLIINGNSITINPTGLLKTGAGNPYRLFNYTGALTVNSPLSVSGPNNYVYTVDTSISGQVNIIVSGGPPVWNGASGSTSNWSDPANWAGVTINAGDPLFFNGPSRLNNVNDTAVDRNYAEFNFVSSAGAFVLNGNSVTLDGNIINNSANAQTINLGLKLSGNRTFNGNTATLLIGGGVTNAVNASTLTLAGTGILTNIMGSATGTETNTILMNATNATWTLANNASSTPMTNLTQLDIQAGTFNFGVGSSAPVFTSITPNGVNARLGVLASAPATLNISGGTLTFSTRLNTGTGGNSIAAVNQSGGVVNVLDVFQSSDGAATASTVINLTGGTFNVGTFTDGNTFFLCSRGTGIVTIANSAVVNCGTFDMSRNAAGNTAGSVGVVNLNTNGTLFATRIGAATGAAQSGGTPTATFNFNGGTLRARASSTTYFLGNASSPTLPITAIVKSGGAIIDTTNFNITIGEPLQHDSALGVTPDGGLIKKGTGTLTIPTVSTYSGTTVISNGTLMLNGSLPASVVTVATGGTLAGNGICGQSLEAQPGSTVSPGTSVGVLTVTNGVSLAGTTIMEIQPVASTNDLLRSISGNISYAGTLIVTNIGGVITNGQTFKLFNAGGGSYAGGFSTIQLPGLGAGQSWNTSQLTVNGTISVTGNPPVPSITSVSASGGNLTISGTGGVTNGTFQVFASTSVTAPLATWTSLGLGQFDGNANFAVLIPIDPATPQRFYILRIP